MLLVLEIWFAAAAALAFYQYTLHQNAAGQADFTVGDVRISHNSKSVEWAKDFCLRRAVMLLRY